MGVVGGAARVVIFGLVHLVALRIKTGARGVAVGAELVEYVFPLIAPRSLARHKGQIEHGAKAGIVGILAVGGVAQIYALVVGEVVRAKKGVAHGAVRLVIVAVVDGTKQSEHGTVVKLL